MKILKKITLIVLWQIHILNYAQIGINTPNPQTLFHVDGAKDNPSVGAPSPTQQLNDFSVNSSGYVGIGTVNPTTNLEINSPTTNAVRIVDTTQGLGKVLTSDSNGYARWTTPSTSFAKLATLPTTLITTPTIDDPSLAGTQFIAYSGAFISLTPGKYQIYFTMWCSPGGPNLADSSVNDGFASVFFSTSSTTNIPPAYLTSIKSVIIPRLYNLQAPASDYYGSGNVAVDITGNTTLYLWVYMSGGNWTAPTGNSIRFRFDPGSYGPYVQMYAVPFEVQ